ncbi:retrovirus-related pol polyprotein from transposon TNT 1-94 [Tanacetum coccineum]
MKMLASRIKHLLLALLSKNGIVERRNRMLVKAARTMLIFSKAPLFLWAEAINTACKLDAKADIGIFDGYALAKKAFKIYNKRTQAIPLSAEEESHELEVAHMSNEPYFGIPIPETIYKESSSSNVISTTVHPDAPISEHLIKLTKDHLIQNIIGEFSRPVSTRLQLHEQALFCYSDAFLTSVEPKTYKEALTHLCWIEAM